MSSLVDSIALTCKLVYVYQASQYILFYYKEFKRYKKMLSKLYSLTPLELEQLDN